MTVAQAKFPWVNWGWCSEHGFGNLKCCAREAAAELRRKYWEADSKGILSLKSKDVEGSCFSPRHTGFGLIPPIGSSYATVLRWAWQMHMDSIPTNYDGFFDFWWNDPVNWTRDE
jgi:hypothetical protein